MCRKMETRRLTHGVTFQWIQHLSLWSCLCPSPQTSCARMEGGGGGSGLGAGVWMEEQARVDVGHKRLLGREEHEGEDTLE